MKKKKKGFTLIELIAVMAMMSIFTLSVQQAYSSTLNIYKKRSAQQDLQFDAKLAINKITKDIQGAKDGDNNIIIDNADLTGTDINKIGSLINQVKTVNGTNPYCNPQIYIQENNDSECFYAIRNSDKALIKVSFTTTLTFASNLDDKEIAEGEITTLEPYKLGTDRQNAIAKTVSLPTQKVVYGIYYTGSKYYLIYYINTDSTKKYIITLNESGTNKQILKDADGKPIYTEEVIANSVDIISITAVGKDVYNVKINLKDKDGIMKNLSSSITKLYYGGEER